jgi:serine/threonine protein kinase
VPGVDGYTGSRSEQDGLMIAFSCPHCGAQLQVKENLAGIARPCPSCSRVVRAPAATAAVAAAGRPVSQGGQRAAEQNSGRSSGHPTLGTSSATEDTAPPVPDRSSTRPYPFLAPAQGPDELGRLGPYVVRKVLGVGAMGVVFQAEDPFLKRPVALKVMKPSLAAFDEYHKRFLREAQLAAAIEHDHIVTIYQVGEDGGVPYLAMKLLQGETLEDRLNQIPGGLPSAEVMRIGREVAEGLAAAHERNLVHRDIKPANVWLEAGRDRVKILDFGLACGTGEDGRFTQAGAVIGTPAYMSPEQANAEDIDSRCDLFSLGAVLYRACTGEMPFGGKDTLSVLSALASKTPPAPHTVVPSLPRAFSDLVMRLLAKNRTKRLQTAREVVSGIQAIEATERSAAEAAAAAPAAKEVIPVARVLKTPAAPPPPASQEVPVARVLKADQPASTNGTKTRETDSEIKRKGTKKGRSRGKKSNKGEPELARIVLLTSLALLGVAIMVLVIGVIARFGSTTSPNGDLKQLEGKHLESIFGDPKNKNGMGQDRPAFNLPLPDASPVAKRQPKANTGGAAVPADNPNPFISPVPQQPNQKK